MSYFKEIENEKSLGGSIIPNIFTSSSFIWLKNKHILCVYKFNPQFNGLVHSDRWLSKGGGGSAPVGGSLLCLGGCFGLWGRHMYMQRI